MEFLQGQLDKIEEDARKAGHKQALVSFQDNFEQWWENIDD